MLRPLLLLLLLSSAALAQFGRATPAPSPAAPPERASQPMWRCSLPGGTFTVALRQVTSVSTHEYVVDTVARVVEVTIDTTGSVIGRFYFLEPMTPVTVGGAAQATVEKLQEAVAEAANRTGTEEVWKKVTKNYPTTTHAHTVEYRLESRAQLSLVFESAEKAFRLGKDTDFKLP